MTTTTPVSAPGVDGRSVAFRAVTVIMGAVVALTFLFGFGNVWLLGLRLGVPAYVAPLVAPAVDLSVLGLLVAIRELALRGAPREEIRPARRLLVFASVVTLALNIAEPIAAGNLGKAAFDAVGPLLLIGWAEVGSGLLHAMRPAGSGVAPPEPHGADVADGRAVAKQHGWGDRPAASEPASATKGCRVDGRAREQDLLHRARAEDVLHWQQHQRPISAETLRKRLHVGAGVARSLVVQLRSDTHTQIESTTGLARGEPQ
ncbi:hypothetical protein [Pseudofrankia sp. BMG5.37]|uniref:hypothetical protein n=1 Tax=Pseudofrankia sp. BMG5.37 TaxID=3050035 RepID=UPI00289579AE|nr:hypothetical protein [Pseudofrankia sp. BMG5.37]MDT3444514.1 hypothetical protein [Pseudofrankia sp. BMG5.37]